MVIYNFLKSGDEKFDQFRGEWYDYARSITFG